MKLASRPLGLLSVGILVCIPGLGACAKQQDAAPTSTPSATLGDEAGTTFPVTVDSVYGKVTLQKKPTRIIVLQAADEETISALGVAPIAYWGDPEDDKLRPWSVGKMLGKRDVSLDATKLESLAKYEPDLIIARTWNFDKSSYEKASEIAPVFAGASEKSVPWRAQAPILSKLTTGSTARGDALVAKAASREASYRKQLPRLQNKTYNAILPQDDGIAFEDGRILSLFGLKAASTQNDWDTAGGFSWELLSPTLIGDVLMAFQDPSTASAEARLRKDPRFAALPAVKSGSAFWVDLDLDLSGPITENAAGERIFSQLKVINDKTR